MTTVRIAKRFNGPAQSGNGGYVCGAIAKAIGESVRVRLHQPPPLEEDMSVRAIKDGEWQVLRNQDIIATATLADVATAVPAAPAYIEALSASKHFPGFQQHNFPTCFVCGPQRARGDGMRIFPGLLPGANVFAAPWLPDSSLIDSSGKVHAEFIWAALDCPGYYAAVPAGRVAMLGDLAVHVDRSVHLDESCVVVGWAIKAAGRKFTVGTALFDEDSERCAVGLATWIELHPDAVKLAAAQKQAQ